MNARPRFNRLDQDFAPADFDIATRLLQDLRGASFSVIMHNSVWFADSDKPAIPKTPGRQETIRVERKGDILTIADVRSVSINESGDRVERVGARLYALKTITLNDASTFMFLPELPGVSDEKFFPAIGTAVLFDAADSAPLRLHACGVDQNTGHRHGWIFEACEFKSAAGDVPSARQRWPLAGGPAAEFMR